ncbi:uncharacterized protein LOC135959837 [Calliphora vicina]|uniref:uncharacterized protein LOC135959837 n=1 Tax=Calliphora vicina TaxID=7373 RepID=UPI00325AFDDB
MFYLIVLIILVFIVWLKEHYSYWEKRNVPFEKPTYFVGNMRGIGRQYHWKDINQRIYRTFKNTTPVAGFYTFLTRAAFILDLDLIKQIMIKDFQSFSERNLFHNERDDPLTGNLLFLDGEKWRVLRHKVSPVFTTGKMRYMFPTVVQVGEKLPAACEKFIEDCGGILEAKDLCARYTTDVIGTCAFGLECNSLIDPQAEFRQMGRTIFEKPRHKGFIQAFMFTNPSLARKLRMKTFRDDVSAFFMQAVRETVEFRQKNHIKRNDFLDMLIEMKEQRDELIKSGQKVDENDLTSGLNIEQLAAQVMVFFLAGFDTSSTTMSFCLYELALNQKVQDQLRQEILDVLAQHDNQITYESIKEMKYLDMVISETLRKYSVTPHLVRKCVKDFQIPNTNIVLEKGLRIIIPLDSIHNDPDYYPEPDNFQPERFLPEQVQKRHPCAYMPFGDGPRNCIGMRFGKMQAQIGLISLLSKFRFDRCATTQIPLRISKLNFLVGTESGIHLKVEKLMIFEFLIICLLAIVAYLYNVLRQRYNYWQKLEIAYEEPTFLLGNVTGIGSRRAFVEVWQQFYDKFKNTGPFAGFYWFFKPAAFVYDPALLKLILIKDFSNFVDRGLYVNEEDDPLSGMLFNLEGNKWRHMRNKLSPTFTSGKMKTMFPIIINISEEFVKVFDKAVDDSEIIEVSDLMARFTTDVIGSCAFGLEMSSLRDPNNKFRMMGRKSIVEQRYGRLGIAFRNSFPKLAKRLHMKDTLQEVEDFFMGIVKETVRYREENNIRRNDFMDMLIDLKNNKLMKSETGEEMTNLTLEEIAAQAFVFLVAGFETSSTTMGFALYELAQHEDIQQKAREQVIQVLEQHNQEFSYEAMKEMVYLDQIIAETLRLYTVLPLISRQALEDYPVPGQPKFVIKKDMLVLIPSGAIHRDERYYPNPNVFNPDNFSAEKVAQRDSVLYLPFGDGPRNCIGMRFGKMQALVGLAVLLKHFKFTVCEKTQIPLTYDKNNFLCSSERGLHLKVTKL